MRKLPQNRRRPLKEGDTLQKTVGCRHSNPDVCAKNSAPNLCAFVRSDGFCYSPPSSWRKLYTELLEEENGQWRIRQGWTSRNETIPVSGLGVDLYPILPSLCMQEVPHPSVVQHRAVKQSDCYSRGNSKCKYMQFLVQLSVQMHTHPFKGLVRQWLHLEETWEIDASNQMGRSSWVSRWQK